MAVASQCPDPLHLQQLLLGRLAPKLAEKFEAHIQQCPHCSKLLPTLLADDTLVEAVRARAKVGLQPHERDLIEGLMQRLQKKRPAAGGDTTTGENTMGVHANDESRQLCSFLAPAQAKDELGRLGGFRILKILGHGGMGVVFQAEDVHLKRSVAIKAMLPEVAKKATARERFLREARAAAALEHDHIVSIYHVGEDRGIPYLVMPFLKGASLDDFMRKKKGEPGASGPAGLTTGQILKVGREIAKGLSAAHEVGLIHRDIKPANVWLDATTGGRVKILDFGLARATSDDAGLTSPGLIVGTPSYMAPEQAQGLPVDGRADLFSLGCVLYKLCTGLVPFKGNDAVSTLLLVATETPRPIEEINRDVPPALCDLVQRLMAKKPQDRPVSAKAVAEEIAAIERAISTSKIKVATVVPSDASQWQQLQTEETRRTGGVRRAGGVSPRRSTWRWIAAGLLGLAAAVLLAVAVFTVKTDDGTFIVETSDPDVAVAINKLGGITIHDEKTGKKFHVKAGKQKLPEGNYDIEVTDPASGLTFETRTFTIKRGQEVTLKVSLDKAVAKLPPDLGKGPPDVAKLPAVNGKVGEVRRFEGHIGVVKGVAFSPDGRSAYSGSLDGTVRRWAVETGKELWQSKPTGKPVDSLALAPDARQALAGFKDGRMWLLDAETGKKIRQFDGHSGSVLSVAISPDGRRALSGSGGGPGKDCTLRLWDLATAKELRTIEHADSVTSVAFLPAGNQVLSATNDSSIRLWDVETGKEVRRFEGHTSRIHGLAVLSDGRRFLSAGSFDHTARLWDVAAPKEIRRFTAKTILSVASSPDNRLAVGGDYDGTIRVWEVESGKELQRFEGHTDQVFSVAVSQDGRYALSGSKDNTVRLWRLPAAGGTPQDVEQRIKEIAKLPADDQVKAVAKWLQELNPGFDGKVEPKFENNQVHEVKFSTDAVADLTPLRALPQLRVVNCRGTQGPDKRPLGKLSDLSPLQGMQITHLYCPFNPIQDLTPLKGLRLVHLSISLTQVMDLKPLEGMPLAMLDCGMDPDTRVFDLFPIRQAPLKELYLVFRPERHAEILRNIPTLQKINFKPAAEVLKQADVASAAADPRIQDIQKLPAGEQVKAVAKWLQELNPGFDGKVTPGIAAGRVEKLSFRTDAVADISPLRALAGLKQLDCDGSAIGKGKVTSLEPLRGLRLDYLHCQYNSPISDLSPLEGMPLADLSIGYTKVADLAPLRDSPLRQLYMSGTRCRDLSPLQGKLLQHLHITDTAIRDLSPLRGMPLYWVECTLTKIDDLSPLRNCPLKYLSCNFLAERDGPVLRSVFSLEKINGQTALDFWKLYDPAHAAFLQWIEDTRKLPAQAQLDAVARKLEERNPGFDGRTVKGVIDNGVVKELAFPSGKVSDTSPVRALPSLVSLSCPSSAGQEKLADLSPLQGMKLTKLVCYNTNVADLSPLRGMPLQGLNITKTKVTDLMPLKDLPLGWINGDFLPERDAALLKSIKTLDRVNDKPAAEFWKEANAKSAAFQQWIEDTRKLEPLRQVEAVRWKLQELNPGYDGRPEYKIENGVVTEFKFLTDRVSDIRPVRALPKLILLECKGSAPGLGKLADLTPLQGMPLASLACHYNNDIEDLAPLRGMPLAALTVSGPQISDLAPLQGMKLFFFKCGGTGIADLKPLEFMPLQVFDCTGTRVTDLSVLRTTEIKELSCDFKPERDAEVLRSIKTLQKINDKPVAEFWKEANAKSAATEQRIKDIQKLPAEEQVKAVAKWLQELNPGFDGKVDPLIEKGRLVRVRVHTDRVADISPVLRLAPFDRLNIDANYNATGRLAVLESLRGLPLKNLTFARNPQCTSLEPLRGIPLIELDCGSCGVRDVGPVQGMPLTKLSIADNPVTDITPLRGMKLARLDMWGTQVTNLAPLADMPLQSLDLANCRGVKDFSPLKGMPLTYLNLTYTLVPDLTVLRGMPLETLWIDVCTVPDLSPLQDLPLTRLRLTGKDRPRDLTPLRGLNLTFVAITPKQVTKGMDVLRQMKSLQVISIGDRAQDEMPAAEFWKRYDAGEFTK